MELGKIAAAIDRLRTANPPPDVFGARHHRFVLNIPLPEPEVAAFEMAHRIRLPDEYRRFLVDVGNGGAGPYYGLFKLGERMDLRDLCSWTENDGVVGVPAEPFPHSGAWNDLSGAPTEDDEEDVSYDQLMEEFEDRYFSPHHMNGAIPIADLGCAHGHWLVVTGPEAGNVWCDHRSERSGIFPLTAEGRARVTFLEWYSDWLETALAKLGFGGRA